jgi:hypothetical protein
LRTWPRRSQLRSRHAWRRNAGSINRPHEARDRELRDLCRGQADFCSVHRTVPSKSSRARGTAGRPTPPRPTSLDQLGRDDVLDGREGTAHSGRQRPRS